MFRSFKTKIFLLTVTILVISSVAFMISTMRGINKAMYEAGEESARNVLELVMLNIENEYKSLIFHKESTLKMRKKQMKNVVFLVYANFDKFYELFKEGKLSEREAQREALEWARSLRYANNDYFFIYNRELTAISHPDPTVMGRNLADYQDPKGNYVLRDLVKASSHEGGGFTNYWWKRLATSEPVPKIGYALYHPKWDWMIGTGVYVDDIEEEARKKLEAIIEGLNDHFSKIRIARTGYFFLFNGKKQMLIHPELAGKDVSKIMNPQTGNPLVDDLMIAANLRGKPFEYLWDKPGARGDFSFPKESYVAHFEPLDWYIASSVYKDEIQLPGKRLIQKQSYIVIAIFLASIAAAYLLVKRVSKPLNKLADYAKDLVAHDFQATDKAKSEVERLPERHKDEVGELAGSFIFLERSLKEYIQKLKETTAAKERIESELNIAREIQMSILPKKFPPFPDRPEFDIYAVMGAAYEVGGDFYDYYPIDKDHLCFVIGDVSGKGVPAALFMAVTKTLLKAVADKGRTPDVILNMVNNELSQDNDASMFITIFCGILNTRTGEIVYANGGHNPPLLIRKDGEVKYIDKTGDLVVGALEQTTYKMERLTLYPGDSLFMFTDGVTEAMNERGELFSEERLKGEISALRGGSIQEIITGIMAKIREFSEGAAQSDDITMMNLYFRGNGINV